MYHMSFTIFRKTISYYSPLQLIRQNIFIIRPIQKYYEVILEQKKPKTNQPLKDREN